MRSYSVHTCDPEGAPLGALDGPTFAEPGRVVYLADSDLYGRVRLWWRCCGTVLVEHISPDVDDQWNGRTYTVRARLDELSPPTGEVSYSVPCVGASWSLTLPCGDLAGEGCTCAPTVPRASSALDGPCTVTGCVADTHCRGCARHTGGDVWCVDCQD